MKTLLFWSTVVLLINAIVCLGLAIVRKHVLERVIAINIVGTKTLVILALLSCYYKRSTYLDAAFVYALLNFLVTAAVTRYVEREGASGRSEAEFD